MRSSDWPTIWPRTRSCLPPRATRRWRLSAGKSRISSCSRCFVRTLTKSESQRAWERCPTPTIRARWLFRCWRPRLPKRRPHPLDGSTGSSRGTKPRRTVAILARSPMRYATTWQAGPGELSTGLFREFSAAAGDSLAERVAAAARAIVARLSGLGPEHLLVWRQRMSLPTWLRPAGATLLLAVAAAPALARASLARLTRPKGEHPLVRARECHRRPWLQSAGAALLRRWGDGVGTSESGEALWSQTGIPSRPGPARTRPPRWRRSVGATLLLLLAVTTATG